MNTNHWIFISPHLDDVVLSCGGLVWDLTQQGHQVEIWTLMAGFPVDEDFSPLAQENHLAWGMSGAAAIRVRREEDHASCTILGAKAHHCDWMDAIYRRDPHTNEPIVHNDQELFSYRPEPALVEEITRFLDQATPKASRLVLPLGLGGHIDHQAVVQAGECVSREENFYADYPYILDEFENRMLWDNRLINIPRLLNQDALKAWQAAVLCYASQLSGFWRDESETCLALRNYLAGGGGRLWERTVS